MTPYFSPIILTVQVNSHQDDVNTCVWSILLHTDDNDCVDNPCGEYGTCIDGDGPGNYTCYCLDGYSQSTPMGSCEGEKTSLMFFSMKHIKMKVEGVIICKKRFCFTL